MPEVTDAIRTLVHKAHSFLLQFYNNPSHQDPAVSIADDVDDIFLWIREDKKVPSSRPEDADHDIELYSVDDATQHLIFQLYIDDAPSEYSVECTMNTKNKTVVVEDLHEM